MKTNTCYIFTHRGMPFALYLVAYIACLDTYNI